MTQDLLPLTLFPIAFPNMVALRVPPIISNRMEEKDPLTTGCLDLCLIDAWVWLSFNFWWVSRLKHSFCCIFLFRERKKEKKKKKMEISPWNNINLPALSDVFLNVSIVMFD